MERILASSLTKAASKQTYYTIKLLADRSRRDDAYRAYAYFRWVDDMIDDVIPEVPDKQAFVARQMTLLSDGYLRHFAAPEDPHEQKLIELIRADAEEDSGLRSYLTNMMEVMKFDAGRRGEFLSQAQLDQYTVTLAVAVTEYLHHFIGHDKYAPKGEARYAAVRAAHIAHMLRDLHEDLAKGYYNIPREVLARILSPGGRLDAHGLRTWVKERVALARENFRIGKQQVSQMESYRCRIACSAYISRFEWMLDTIEKEGHCLREEYSDRKSAKAAISIGYHTLNALHRSRFSPRSSIIRGSA